ncbi:hypothetical protein TRFO_15038 [Tritrichomonas foetus]|uniref:Protein kinase domain-containing protein n=1 Tax=Tritrichomonas foetus TaxID=1144522 RepID=A0A1J4KXV3_9EUKA|nr:hypothetical protein TRFO_15038 [Tritrichomonas foetus]|eukprot:OHT14524.1 hypothetical protein TRFO_15038 [Tritrichomonas foetus]
MEEGVDDEKEIKRLHKILKEVTPLGFEEICPLGDGAFSRVFRAKFIPIHSTKLNPNDELMRALLEASDGTNQIPQDLALKVFKKSKCNIEMVKKEYRINKSLKHKNIIKCLALLETENYLILVLEFVHGISLLDFVNIQNFDIPEFKCKIIYQQIASAIYYMHVEKNIVHRDLKLDNIMVDDDLNIKIIDFGLSCQKDDTASMSRKCGSLPYAAPEIFVERPSSYTQAIDVWSSGVCLFALLYRNLPFSEDDPTELTNSIVYQQLEFLDNFDYIDLLQRLLEKNYKQRITIQDVVKHPWISNSRSSNCASVLKAKTMIYKPQIETGKGAIGPDGMKMQHSPRIYSPRINSPIIYSPRIWVNGMAETNDMTTQIYVQTDDAVDTSIYFNSDYESGTKPVSLVSLITQNEPIVPPTTCHNTNLSKPIDQNSNLSSGSYINQSNTQPSIQSNSNNNPIPPPNVTNNHFTDPNMNNPPPAYHSKQNGHPDLPIAPQLPLQSSIKSAKDLKPLGPKKVKFQKSSAPKKATSSAGRAILHQFLYRRQKLK